MNDKAHYVVGEVGFGPSFGAEAGRVEMLEAQVARLIKDRNLLRRVLQDCATLSEDVANRKHEALLATAP